MYMCYFLFFKQKTAYELRIRDWRSDVCSSYLGNDDGRQSEADFVDKQKLRFCHQCAPDSDHLLLATRQGSGGLTAALAQFRSDERRVGKACVIPCRSRW